MTLGRSSPRTARSAPKSRPCVTITRISDRAKSRDLMAGESGSCPAESSCRKGNLYFLCAPCCIRQGLGNVFSEDMWIGRQDLFSGVPRSDQSDEGSDCHPGALDARFAGHDGWISGDAIKLVHRANVRLGTSTVKKCGQGRGRTVDLPIFSRTLVPTELPGRTVSLVG